MKADRGFASGRTALVGVTSTNSVRRYIEEQRKGSQEAILLVKSGRESDFAGLGIPVAGFGSNHVTPFNYRLLLALCRFRPDEIVVLCGPLFFHGNVLSSLVSWNRFLPKGCSISYWVEGRGINPVPMFPGKHFSLAFHLVLLAVLAGAFGAVLSLDRGWMWGIGILFLALFLEFALRSASRMDRAVQSMNALPSGQVIRGFDLYDYHPKMGFKN